MHHITFAMGSIAVYYADMLKRPSKTQVVVRLNDDLVKRLDAEAERIGRTRTEVVTRAVEAFIASLPAPKKPA